MFLFFFILLGKNSNKRSFYFALLPKNIMQCTSYVIMIKFKQTRTEMKIAVSVDLLRINATSRKILSPTIRVEFEINKCDFVCKNAYYQCRSLNWKSLAYRNVCVCVFASFAIHSISVTKCDGWRAMCIIALSIYYLLSTSPHRIDWNDWKHLVFGCSQSGW